MGHKFPKPAETPTSQDLTEEEVNEFRQILTVRPTTIITNDKDAHMQVSYHTKLDSLEAKLTRLYNQDLNNVINGGN